MIVRMRAITKNRIYNCKRGANAININEQKEKIRIKVLEDLIILVSILL